VVTIFGPRPSDESDRIDPVRVCYQHCCLRYVIGEKISNRSLRERFKLPEEKAETASRIVRDPTEENWSS
jgi:ATP-dependent DNA helicase RecG